MDSTIFLFLVQDGITNGAVYALLGFALVLVFAVTRIVLIPQGEFVAYGGLTYAVLQAGQMPGTVWLMLTLGLAAFVLDVVALRRELTAAMLLRAVATKIALPLAILGACKLGTGPAGGPLLHAALTIAIVGAIGPYLYRIAFEPMADASVLTLFITAMGVHLAMLGLGLVLFGPEGLRAPPLVDVSVSAGPLMISAQSIAVYLTALVLMVALYLFFDRTVTGKALRATAMNRVGARLVGIRLALSGRLALALAAAIGAVSGILIVPATTLYYDTGFLIGLKGFVAAIIGGLVSHPVTAVAALLVGLVEAFAAFFASNYKEVIVFTLLLPVLVWRSLAVPHVDEEQD